MEIEASSGNISPSGVTYVLKVLRAVFTHLFGFVRSLSSIMAYFKCRDLWNWSFWFYSFFNAIFFVTIW